LQKRLQSSFCAEAKSKDFPLEEGASDQTGRIF